MINYVFYSIYLMLLLTINLTHVCMLAPIPFFIAEACLQSVFEMALIAYLGSFIKSKMGGLIYIGGAFLLLMIHLIDFILARVMSMNFWFTLDLMLEESLENFIEMLLLTGVPPLTWGLLFVGSASLLIILSFVVHRMSFRSGRLVKREVFFRLLCVLPLASLFLGLGKLPSPYEYQKGVETLPFKHSLVVQNLPQLQLNESLHIFPKNTQQVTPLTKKPNLYLVISESLREDYLTEETAPSLVQFRNENIKVSRTFSNANATHNSWFSIFHSRLPFHWQSTNSGSVPLVKLKEMGYKVRVYSSAQLKYYHMDQNLFGENLSLIDHFQSFPHYPPHEAWLSDAAAVEHMMNDLDIHREGTVFIVFLDATHFEYSWPSHFPIKFTPVDRDKTHIRLSSRDKETAFIENRYKNSISYADHLMGLFFGALKSKGLYEEAMIVFTGDHGEEFYEEGHLFHASHLSAMQISPPIYYKLGDNSRYHALPIKPQMTSHIDIFPTLFDALGAQNLELDGQSLFAENRWPYVVVTRYHGARAPFEFCLIDGMQKVTFRFLDRKKIFSSKKLEVVSIQNMEDKHLNNFNIKDFDLALQKLFCK
ncbi:MAG: sulfatase-like hydrolase/transferase [Simkaniaceae bacterium]|nr:sulfatase-like hydrolase/transferase [Simkaniaceae bacterium]